MSTLNEKILHELQLTEVHDLTRLISFMNGEKKFFWVRSKEHDHWTNGTAQHSWRVYQYMRYLWEHPEEIHCNRKDDQELLAPSNVKHISLEEIILTGLLHDVGKTWSLSHHASNSKKIIDRYLGQGFSERFPCVTAAIFFHHNTHKDGGKLNKYKYSALKKLLNKADSMASGTTWNSKRFKEHRSQHSGNTTRDIGHLRRVAMDRTQQVLHYRMYLDCHYNFVHIAGYARKNIIWNTREDVIRKIYSSEVNAISIPSDSDYVSTAHHLTVEDGGKFCIVVGIDFNGIVQEERNLRQDNPAEEELLICSNVLFAFYQPKDIGSHRYSYTMRQEIAQYYELQSLEKGILLPDVTFFRDGVSEGFRMVSPWKCDVLLVPNWKGAAIVDGINEK